MTCAVAPEERLKRKDRVVEGVVGLVEGLREQVIANQIVGPQTHRLQECSRRLLELPLPHRGTALADPEVPRPRVARQSRREHLGCSLPIPVDEEFVAQCIVVGGDWLQFHRPAKVFHRFDLAVAVVQEIAQQQVDFGRFFQRKCGLGG